MESPIELIHRFNVDAGLLDKGYDDMSSSTVTKILDGYYVNIAKDKEHENAKLRTA